MLHVAVLSTQTSHEGTQLPVVTRTLPGGADEGPAPHSTAAASAPAAKPAAAAAALRLKPSVPSGGSASDSDSSRQAPGCGTVQKCLEQV